MLETSPSAANCVAPNDAYKAFNQLFGRPQPLHPLHRHKPIGIKLQHIAETASGARDRVTEAPEGRKAPDNGKNSSEELNPEGFPAVH